MNELAKTRSVGNIILYYIISFGLYSFAWVYNNLKEIETQLNKDLNATLKTVLLIVPIVNIFVLYFIWKDVDEFITQSNSDSFNPLLYLLLTIFIPFAAIFTYISVQTKLNAAWMVRTNGQAVKAELNSLDKIMIFAGITLIVLYILFFIIIAAL